jgi:hypothetical protein
MIPSVQTRIIFGIGIHLAESGKAASFGGFSLSLELFWG